jgi:hypothetical protein
MAASVIRIGCQNSGLLQLYMKCATDKHVRRSPSKASLIVYLREIPWQVFFLTLFAPEVMAGFVDECDNVT